MHYKVNNDFMSNSFFAFKQFSVTQLNSDMKVSTDACFFGAWGGSTNKK